MTIVALGMATTIIGGAELLGEGLTASFADRLGLRSSVILGLALSGVSYAVLPLAAWCNAPRQRALPLLHRSYALFTKLGKLGFEVGPPVS